MVHKKSCSCLVIDWVRPYAHDGRASQAATPLQVEDGDVAALGRWRMDGEGQGDLVGGECAGGVACVFLLRSGRREDNSGDVFAGRREEGFQESLVAGVRRRLAVEEIHSHGHTSS